MYDMNVKASIISSKCCFKYLHVLILGLQDTKYVLNYELCE